MAHAVSGRPSSQHWQQTASTSPPDTAATGWQPRTWPPSWPSRDTRCHCTKGNVGKPEDCERVVAEVLAKYDHLDYLINNAGITVDKTMRNMTVDDWHAVLRVNLSGAFYMTKAALEHMIGRGFGRIVNISSIIGETGSIGQANYAASKSGLFGLTKSLALETARKGITVNCVAPGFIDTEMVAAVPKEALDRVIANIPMRRLGRPAEIAHTVRFLLQDEAAYITGSVLSVNGGMEM